MNATRQSTWVLVSVSSEDTRRFNRQFPCSNIPDGSTLLIELDARNGDLVNLTMRTWKTASTSIRQSSTDQRYSR